MKIFVLRENRVIYHETLKTSGPCSFFLLKNFITIKGSIQTGEIEYISRMYQTITKTF